MKKFMAIAMIGGLVLASCSKKEATEEVNATSDSAVVEAPVVDSVAAPVVDSTAVAPVATDSTATK